VPFRLAALLLALTAAPAAAQLPPAAEPVTVQQGVARLSPEAFVPDPATGLRIARLRFAPLPPSVRLSAAAARDDSPEGRLLAELMRRGAAGNHRDLYDNRDRAHSALRLDRHPQMSATAYDEAAKAQGLDYGVNPGLAFDTITIGNSSTALTGGPFWRSIPRATMTHSAHPAILERLYAANHLYVYPEHRDHDPERGDLFPAATAQMVVSQGSSGSDRAFLRALAHTLAALRPDTKARLRETGLVAPMLQRLLRRAMAGIDDDAAYMGPAAHPAALDPGRIDPMRMMRHAAALRADAIPPAVRLHLRAEPEPGETFADGYGERLFDTADAVARVARGPVFLRRYRLSTAGTEDPNGRPLRFHWRVLRGPGVTVTPLDDAGTEAVVDVPWTEPYPAPGTAAAAGDGGGEAAGEMSGETSGDAGGSAGPETADGTAAAGDAAGAPAPAAGLTTFRIDVAVFADNGAELSAPAFFSVAFPPTERRRHDAVGRLLEIAFDPPDLAGRYADPALFPWRGWRDLFDYGPEGRLLGWTRTLADGRQERYTAQGLRVIDTDALGRPLNAEAMAYPVRPAERRERDGRPRVEPEPTGQRFLMAYGGSGDRIGRPIAVNAPP
jgi:hypothetical protein